MGRGERERERERERIRIQMFIELGHLPVSMGEEGEGGAGELVTNEYTLVDIHVHFAQ